MPAIFLDPVERLIKVIANNVFPMITSYTLDITTKSLIYNLNKEITATDVVAAVTSGAPAFSKVFLHSNNMLVSGCTAIGLQYTCVFSSLTFPADQPTQYIPEVITNYGRLEVSSEVLCNSDKGNFTYYPYYGCNCTNLLNYLNNTCVDNCPNYVATSNNTICNYCASGFKADGDECVETCPIDKIPKPVPNNPSAFYCAYCDEVIDGGKYVQEGVCVSSCVNGYGVKNGTFYCENCASIGKYSENYTCIDNCTVDRYRGKENATVNSKTVSVWSCKYCDNTTLLAQWDNCVENCTAGFQYINTTLTNQTDLRNHCYPCSYNNTYEIGGTCSLNECLPWHKKFMEPNYCLYCLDTEVISNNTCLNSCPSDLAINNTDVKIGNATGIKTICKKCSTNEYLVTQSCKPDEKRCKMQTKSLDTIRSCMSECPPNTIINSINKTCDECTGLFPVILNEKCAATCYPYQELSTYTNRCNYCKNSVFFNNKCVDSCGDYTIFNKIDSARVCTNCKDHITHNYYFKNKCTACCPLDHYEVRNSITGKNECKFIKNNCPVDFCLNGGTCDIVNGEMTCSCKTQYFGRRCEAIKENDKTISGAVVLLTAAIKEACNFLDNPLPLKMIPDVENTLSNAACNLKKMLPYADKEVAKVVLECKTKSERKMTEDEISDFLGNSELNKYWDDSFDNDDTSINSSSTSTTTTSTTNSTTSNTTNTTTTNSTVSNSTNNTTNNSSLRYLLEDTENTEDTEFTDKRKLWFKRNLQTVYIANEDIRGIVGDMVQLINAAPAELLTPEQIANNNKQIKEMVDSLAYSSLNELYEITKGILFQGTSLTIRFGPIVNKKLRNLQETEDESLVQFNFDNCTFKTSDENYKNQTSGVGVNRELADPSVSSLVSSALEGIKNTVTSLTSTPTTTTATATASFNANKDTVWYIVKTYNPTSVRDKKITLKKDESIEGYSDYNEITFVHDDSKAKTTTTAKSTNIVAECPTGFLAKFPIKREGLDFTSYNFYKSKNSNILNRNDPFFKVCSNYSDSVYADATNIQKLIYFNSYIYCGNTGCTFDSLENEDKVICKCYGNINQDYYFNYYTSYINKITNVTMIKTMSNLGILGCASKAFVYGIGGNYGLFAMAGIGGVTLIAMVFSCFKSDSFEDQSHHPENVGQSKKVGKIRDYPSPLDEIKEVTKENDEIENEQNTNKEKYDVIFKDFSPPNTFDEKNELNDVNRSPYKLINKGYSNSPKKINDKIGTLFANEIPLKSGARGGQITKPDTEVALQLQDNQETYSQTNRRAINNFMHSADKPNQVGDQGIGSKKKQPKLLKNEDTENRDTRPSSAERRQNELKSNSNNNITKVTKDNSFGSIFLEEIRSNHLIARLFLCNDLTKNKYVLALNFCLFYSMMFLVSGLSYVDIFIAKLYIHKTTLEIPSAGIAYIFSKEIIRVLATLLAPIVFSFIFTLVTLVPKNFVEEYTRDLNTSQDPRRLRDYKFRLGKAMVVKTVIYGIIVLVFFIISFIYSVAFCGVYPKTAVEFATTGGICLGLHTLVLQPVWLLIKSAIVMNTKGKR